MFDTTSVEPYSRCQRFFTQGVRMTYEEKGTWVYLVACTAAYAVYLTIIIARLASTSAGDVSYVAVLLWTTAASILASVIGRTLVESARPSDRRRADVRDRDISRLGEYASRWFVAAGAGAALIMAMARWDYFWIANVLYLGFVLWAVAGSVVRLVAYPRGVEGHASQGAHDHH